MDRATPTPVELQERLRAERAQTPFLLYRDDRGRQHIRALPASTDRIVLGRHAQADVSLAWDPEVSGLHAVLERVAGEWTVIDDGLSSNGTSVGARPLRGRRRLRDGDVLRLGSTQVTFRDPAVSVREVTQPAEERATIAKLSDAQRRVLVALCRPRLEGRQFAPPASNREIADELHLSVDAVKSHLRAVFEKFAVPPLPQNAKRAQLVEMAVLTGTVTPRDLTG